jgi:multidrug efflux pump subunit AcrB
MAFVTGLMGPYMSPIPINASMGMFISLVVAFVVTPWLTYKVMRRVLEAKGDEGHGHEEGADRWLQNLFERVVGPFLKGDEGKSKRFWLGIGILVLILLSLSLGYFKVVVLKMLPFDDKSEFQIVLDMPEGTALEQTARVLGELADYVATVPEVTDYQVYAGTASPINFNGLVRQYYLRSGANVGDIQVNLLDKSQRDRKSHRIALDVRAPLQEIGRPYGANVKIVEVPPGPPVQSPLVAEVYGLNYAGQIQVAKELRQVFEQTPDIIDIDDSVETPSVRYILHVDRQRAAHLGVSQQTVSQAIATVLDGEDLGYLHGASTKYAIPIRVEFTPRDKAHLDDVLALKVRSRSGELVPLSEVVEIERTTRERSIYHKDLLPVVFITADMAGELDSPLYGMFDIVLQLFDEPLPTGGLINQYFVNQPEDPYEYSVKWDGEWQVTYETFRDMGIAYSVGLILIYLLIVAQFRSYLVPLIIMAPIPLTIIGVMPGHALWDAKFTATSMIGMIALAGIIVRNSILLVDFINAEVRGGADFEAAVIRSGAVRAKPIALTGLAAIGGAYFILDDPIFSGLAVSLISGIFVSTVLTLVVIPVLYYAAMRKRIDKLLA